MTFSASSPGIQSLEVMKEEENRTNVEQEDIASTERDALKARFSDCQNVITQKSVIVQLPAPSKGGSQSAGSIL